MNSLCFPDANVWLALVSPDHAQREAALAWWETSEHLIAFRRFTQMGLPRLLTNASVMNGKPLSLRRAWSVHDALYQDDRVRFLNEPGGIEDLFRAETASPLASPKVLADAYLLSFAACTGASLVTFDRALARRNRQCLLLS